MHTSHSAPYTITSHMRDATQTLAVLAWLAPAEAARPCMTMCMTITYAPPCASMPMFKCRARESDTGA